jgi:hypothetical protein
MSEKVNSAVVQKEKKEILKRAEDILLTAKAGLEDLISGLPEKKVAGLRNLIVFGRAVTNVLQNLRSVDPTFDDWYQKYRQEMESDPLMKYFYKLRSEILKEGKLEFFSHTYIPNFRIPEDIARLGPPPPNAKGFFIGDRLGGSGWEIQLPDGSTEKKYVHLPYDIGIVSLRFPDPPESHLGIKIQNKAIEKLSTMFIGYIARLVNLAKEKFNIGG